MRSPKQTYGIQNFNSSKVYYKKIGSIYDSKYIKAPTAATVCDLACVCCMQPSPI